MSQQKSSIDPFLKIVSLLKNFGFLFAVGFLFIMCLENTYDRLYGDTDQKEKLENLLENGKTVIANLDENYTTSQTKIGNTYMNTYEFKYSFKVNDKVYSKTFSTKEFIPRDPERLTKYLTVHYLPEDPDTNQIDAELEYEFAKDAVNDHGIGMLLLNIVGLLITFILVLFAIILIRDKIKNFDKPIENTYQKAQVYNEVAQKTDYSKIR